MTAKIGDVVTVSTVNHTYDMYWSWADCKKHVPLFSNGNLPIAGKQYLVTHTGLHDNGKDTLFVLDGEFIVGEYAFNIEGKANGLQDSKVCFGKISYPRSSGWMADCNHSHVPAD